MQAHRAQQLARSCAAPGNRQSLWRSQPATWHPSSWPQQSAAAPATGASQNSSHYTAPFAHLHLPSSLTSSTTAALHHRWSTRSMCTASTAEQQLPSDEASHAASTTASTTAQPHSSTQQHPPGASSQQDDSTPDSCTAAASPPASPSSSLSSSDDTDSDSSSPAAGSRPRRADKGRPYPLMLSRPIGPFSYRLVLGYDGTDYCGFQLQRSRPTVQGMLEQALTTRLQHSRDYINVRGAGRTDAGVHARGQVAQFFTDKELQLDRLPYQINRLLPHDIRVQEAYRTAPDFNVSFSSCGKTYHYWVDTGKYPDAIHQRYRWHVPEPLDLEAMRAGAAVVQGTHDFTQFCNDNSDRTKRNPVKTLWSVEVVEVPGGLCIQVHGSGFLYRMVRHLAGSLVAVGQGRLPLDNIALRLELGDSCAPGEGGVWRGYNVAPAKGLVLQQVEYPAEVDDPGVWLYPELPHNEWGQCLVRVPGENYEAQGLPGQQ